MYTNKHSHVIHFFSNCMYKISLPKHQGHWGIGLLHFLQPILQTLVLLQFSSYQPFPHHFTCKKTSQRSRFSQSPTATSPLPALTKGQQIQLSSPRASKSPPKGNKFLLQRKYNSPPGGNPPPTSDSSAMQPMSEDIWSPLLQCLVATTLAPICPSMLYLQRMVQ